jgi:hypothetical protein
MANCTAFFLMGLRTLLLRADYTYVRKNSWRKLIKAGKTEKIWKTMEKVEKNRAEL